MSRLNVVTADRNSKDLEALYLHIRNSAELDHFTLIFDDFVEQLSSRKEISVNATATRLSEMLAGHTYTNMHDAYKGRNPSGKNLYWYNKRKEIERRLGFGKDRASIYYGALNTGNVGVQQYGPYCLVLAEKSSAHAYDLAKNTSFLPTDSYSYVFTWKAVSMPLGQPTRPFLKDMAVWENVGYLAVIKFYRVIKEHYTQFSEPELNNLILEPFRPDFIEAQMYLPQSFGIEDVKEVRVTNRHYQKIKQLRDKKKLPGVTLDPVEEVALKEEAIIHGLWRRGISLTIL